MRATSRIASYILAVPIVTAVVVILVVIVFDRTGLGWWSHDAPRNIAEAAAMGRAAEVVRFLRFGDDPTRILPVRPQIAFPSTTYLTAFEGAVWSRSVQLLRLLEEEGLPLDDAMRGRLACLAVDLERANVAAYLAPAGEIRCEAGAAASEVTARTAAAENDH
ncbi:MAG: hypothetical protein ABL971_08390 [Vicinamibacterales bacterium]